MRHQSGYIFKKGHSWFGRWREDAIVNGQVVRRQCCEKLADYCDRYRAESDVRTLLAQKLARVNEGRSGPAATLTVVQYAEQFFFPHVEAELKPATVRDYRAMWRTYLADELGERTMRDFRCVDATNVLAEIHRKRGVGRWTLRHAKSLLSAIFTFAKRRGDLDGVNPVQGAGIPRKAAPLKPTHAYRPGEVAAMLGALTDVAKVAVALMYFAGLRPGEARGMKWGDYDGKRLTVRRSVWGTYVTEPKTAESVAPIPVCETLAAILGEHRNGAGCVAHILSGPLGRPIDLHNLAARVVRPALSLCAECHKEKKGHPNGHEFKPLPEWRGWYALRRGAATLATQVESPLAAKGLLRHKNIATTQAHYIKDVPAETLRAAEKMDALFQAPSGQRPN
jgi:integrase